MKKITWSYMACLTDAEGSIFYAGRGKSLLQISWTQGEENSWWLDHITAFLSKEKISYSDSWAVNNGGHNFRRIVVGEQRSVRKCLLKMIPHLILKEEKAVAGIEHLNEKEAAKERREATCKYGHPRTPENVYVQVSTGKASCLVCRRERGRGSVPGYAAPR